MNPDSPDFPIVGVGASAGGLDAYRRLLRGLPANSGAAYVFIQHLDPNHESMMADLLARHTSMTVVQAEDDMKVEPNNVYVIPPNKFIKLVDHGLFLDEPIAERGARMSVDYFFRSLAEVRGEKAIGIVLSGTGSDGTLGCREIKAAGGMVIVQKPDTSEYDGMPRSAVGSGAVDFILPVDEMGETLKKYFRHPYLMPPKDEGLNLAESEPEGFRTILSLLHAHTDYDFKSYKKGTLERRIHRRMGLKQISSLGDYVDYLRENRSELSFLFKDLLIGVTRFFREADAWEYLSENAIASIAQRKPDGSPLRAWIPGCSSGEEAYTLAITIFDRLATLRKSLDVQIFATDLNADAITTARAGVYPKSISADVPPAALKHHFIEDDEHYRVTKRLREKVIFAQQNVISDPPFSNLDIIACRNLMIYLEHDIQQRMIEMFHFALADGGVLFLGSSETADRPSGLFDPISKPHRIYRRTETTRFNHGSFPIVASPARPVASGEGKPVDQHYVTGVELAKRTLLQRFVPAAVLVNHRLEVQYYHGPLRNYLDFPTGEPTSELPSMALEGLRRQLRAVLSSVQQDRAPAENIAINVPRNGHEVSVKISAEPVAVPGGGEPHILVYFEDVTAPRDRVTAETERAMARASASSEESTLLSQLEYELQATREDLQSTIEAMETANEELKASNEEVMSMNEELQSTNEELETSREELQSLNEELSTVNNQLEDKIEEVESSNNDLANLLTSTDIATVFLDTNLRIRRFTPATKDVWSIIESDIGRHIGDLTSRFEDPDLISGAKRVLDKLQPVEAEVQRDDVGAFIRRILPYRTSDNKIEGVVITLTDVTKLRDALAHTRVREQQQEAVAELGRMALSREPLDKLFDKAVQSVATHLNLRYAKILELRRDEDVLLLRNGTGWNPGLVGTTKIGTGSTSQAGYTLERSSAVVVEDFATERRFTAPKLLSDHNIACGASVVIGPTSKPWGVLGAHDTEIGRCGFTVDDTNFMQAVANILWLTISRREAEEQAEAERLELRQLTDALPFRMAVISDDEHYIFTNKAYSVWGKSSQELEGAKVADVVDKDAYQHSKPHIDAALAGEVSQFQVTISPPTGVQETDLVIYSPRQGADGKQHGFYAAAIDMTAQKEAEAALAERTAQYQTIGESIPYGVWTADAGGKCTYVSPSFLELVGKSAEDVLTFGWLDVLAPGTADETIEAWQACVENECDWEHEHRFLGKDGQIYTILSLGRPVRDIDGKITSWAGINLDISERKREEERLAIVSAELDHRVKNILATVSTIARQTGRSAVGVRAFVDDLEKRIQSLADAHRMLANDSWTGMSLHALVSNELQPYIDSMPGRIEVAGATVTLAPHAVQSMALAIHELTTNAAKYGALKDNGGRLHVAWEVDYARERPVSLVWDESGLTSVSPPSRKGFGSTMIEEVMRHQLQADVTVDFRPSGVRVTMDLPSSCFVGN